MSPEERLTEVLRQSTDLSSQSLDEALARQAIFGGELIVHLLELPELSPARLLPLLGEAWQYYPQAEHELSFSIKRSLPVVQAGLTAVVQVEDKKLYLIVSSPPSTAEQEKARRLIGAYDLSVALPQQLSEALAKTREVSLEAESLSTSSQATSVELPAAATTIIENEKADFSMAVPKTTLAATHPWTEHQETAPPPKNYAHLTNAPVKDDIEDLSITTALPKASIQDVRSQLKLAEDKTQVAEAILRYSGSIFRFSALFSVAQNELRGLKAVGSSKSDITSIRFPLDLKSSVKRVCEKKQYRIIQLKASGLEGGLYRDLQRPLSQSIFLWPILLRNRVVLLLWGDQGQSDVDISQIGELSLLQDDIAEALERLLLKRKRASRAAQPLDHVPAPPDWKTAANNMQPTENIEALRDDLNQPRNWELAINEEEEEPKTEVQLAPPPSEEFLPEDAEETTHALPLNSSPLVMPSRTLSETPSEFAPREHPTLLGLQKNQAGQIKTTRTASWDENAQVSPNIEPVSSHPLESAESLRFDAEAHSHASSISSSFGDHSTEDVVLPQGSASKTSPTALSNAKIVSLHYPSKSVPPPPLDGNSSELDDIEQAAQREVKGTLISQYSRSELPAGDNKNHASPRPLEAKPLTSRMNYDSVVDDLIANKPRSLQKLMDGGESAVGALVMRFPGPIDESFLPTDDPATAGPICAALIEAGQKAVPFITVRTADESPTIRRFATLILGQIPSQESARAIARRLHDSDESVRIAAELSAQRSMKDLLAARALSAQLEQMIRDEKLSHQERGRAIGTIARLGRVEALPTLLRILEQKNEVLSEKVIEALTTLTCHDYGNDLEEWQNFWLRNRNMSRAIWLTEAMLNKDKKVRQRACETIRPLVMSLHGYEPNATGSERELAVNLLRVELKQTH